MPYRYEPRLCRVICVIVALCSFNGVIHAKYGKSIEKMGLPAERQQKNPAHTSIMWPGITRQSERKELANGSTLDPLALVWNILKLYCGFMIVKEKIHGDTSTWHNLLTTSGCGVIGLSAMIDGAVHLKAVYHMLLMGNRTKKSPL